MKKILFILVATLGLTACDTYTVKNTLEETKAAEKAEAAAKPEKAAEKAEKAEAAAKPEKAAEKAEAAESDVPVKILEEES